MSETSSNCWKTITPARKRINLRSQGFEGICNSLWDMQLRRKRLEGVTTVVSTAFSWMRYSSEKAGATAMHQRSLVSTTFKALPGKADLPSRKVVEHRSGVPCRLALPEPTGPG